MLFNSLQFAVFFIIVYGLYVILNHKWQNRLLLVASYVFYGAWDWRFLSLIFISTAVDYYCGLEIDKTRSIKRRKFFLFLSIFVNLSILGFFKYFGFFADNLRFILNNFGFSAQDSFLRIILPVGISFYTFQTMSYTIDIYRGQMRPTKKFFDFALFVAFFPQLVAGPIERAKHLLPQILFSRRFNLDRFYEGCFLIFWGLFQKVFIADNLAKIVDPVFAGLGPHDGIRVLLALYGFAFQIFCDFAGYSNMARGIGRLMGFDIMVNFRVPYFAKNPKEFWQRWHISLSSWLKDYLYIPLGGNRRGVFITYRNLMFTMLLGGLWHGAAWTFIVWGAYHGLLLIIYRLFKPLVVKMPQIKNLLIQRLWAGLRIVFFFNLVCLGWLFFRADSLTQAFSMLGSLFCNFQFSLSSLTVSILVKTLFFTAILLVVNIWQYKRDDLFVIFRAKPLFQVSLYLIIFYSLLLFRVVTSESFIYFQF